MLGSEHRDRTLQLVQKGKHRWLDGVAIVAFETL